MYTTIKAYCVDQTLQVSSIPKLASGGENEIRIEVSFDSYWDGLGKTAIFYRKENQVYHVVMVNGVCVIPREVLTEPGKLYFGIIGASGTSVRTSEVVVLNVAQGAITGLGNLEPLPDVYKQVLSAYASVENDIAKETAERKKEVAVERARIDNLVASGTVDDAELLDVRVGADGTTYASAGESVREQIGKLSTTVDELAALVPTWEVGYYIEETTGKQIALSGIYCCTGFMRVYPTVMRNLHVLTACAADSSAIAFYDENGVCVSAENIGRRTDTLEFFDVSVPDDAYYFRYTCSVQHYEASRVYCDASVFDVCRLRDDLSGEAMSLYRFVPENVLCIGDSLTAGAYYVNGIGGASIKQNYPYYLGKMCDCAVTNASVSGWSASDWYNNRIGAYSYGDFDTVIIWLGTNYGCAAMPSDAEIDAFEPDGTVAAAEADQAQYLIRIIKTILSENPVCHVMLCNAFASKSTVKTHNGVIAEIATKFDLQLVDMSDLTAANYPELHGGIENPHFGKAGNIYLADRFACEINNYYAEDPVRAERTVTML